MSSTDSLADRVARLERAYGRQRRSRWAKILLLLLLVGCAVVLLTSPLRASEPADDPLSSFWIDLQREVVEFYDTTRVRIDHWWSHRCPQCFTSAPSPSHNSSQQPQRSCGVALS